MSAVASLESSLPGHGTGFLRMDDVPLAGRRVLMRVDFNVPLRDGEVVSDHRIRACVPTIRDALQKKAAVILVSHLGRPEEGRIKTDFSLAPLVPCLERLLGMPVRFASIAEPGEILPGEVVLLENIRFSCGEKNNDPRLARLLASLCDVFVMDAFSCAHRRHASTCGVIEASPIACAGPLLCAEFEAILRVVDAFDRPLVVVVGGSKISTKLGVLESLSEKADCLLTGGGIANTLLAASGYDVGSSLYEQEGVEDARRLQARMRERGTRLLLPVDVVCARSPDDRDTAVRQVDQVGKDEMILDLGPRSCELVEELVMGARTILWNGPVGVFERAPFAEGTRRLATAIAKSRAYSLVGGGETLAAVAQYGVADNVTYISTGGGALLEFIEKGDLPAAAALRARVSK